MRKNQKKRIGIDARFYGPLGKGLGRYTQEIVDNVINIDQENEYIIFLCRENFDEFVCDGQRVKKVLADVRWYTFKEQVVMPFLILKQRLDLIHYPHFNVPILTPIKYVVTIHDLILTKFPTVRASTLSPFLYKLKNFLYKIVISLAVKRAKKVIAVSEFTKSDIRDKFKIKADKIAVTYEGVANLAKGRDSLFVSKIDDKKTLLEYNIYKKYLLYVGNAYPHKNLEGLLSVFKKILRNYNDMHLVLVGKEDYFYERVKKEAQNLKLWQANASDNPVIFPGYVPDAELEVIYKKALAYVFPSYYEGFGLPPLEAMAKKCAVVSSRQSSMPEILQDAALYFNPHDLVDMQAKIEKIISDEKLRETLKEKGSLLVKKYSWWECARQTLEVYDKILNKTN